MHNSRPRDPSSIQSALGDYVIPSNAPHYLSQSELVGSFASTRLEPCAEGYMCKIPIERESHKTHATLWPFLVNPYERFIKESESPFKRDSDSSPSYEKWRVLIVNSPKKSRRFLEGKTALGEVVLFRRTEDTDFALLPQARVQYMLDMVLGRYPDRGIRIDNASANRDYVVLTALKESSEESLVKKLAETVRLQTPRLPMLYLKTPKTFR